MKEIKERLKKEIEGKITFRANKSYVAVWRKKGKNEDLILCLFQGKKKVKACLPWSSINLLENPNLNVIIEKFLNFKKNHSISKEIDKFEKQLKAENLI